MAIIWIITRTNVSTQHTDVVCCHHEHQYIKSELLHILQSNEYHNKVISSARIEAYELVSGTIYGHVKKLLHIYQIIEVRTGKQDKSKKEKRLYCDVVKKN